MKITFNKSVRNIEAGTVIDFGIIEKVKHITLVGDNGCGKSTIIQSIRGCFPPTTKSMFEDEYTALSKAAQVEIEHNYEKVFFLDAVLDNGTHFKNAYDAPSLIKMGGFDKGRKSHGEGSLIDISRFMENNKSKIVPDKTLIVFDEIDNGFSLKNMSIFINFINKLIHEYKCHVIISTHNPFFISQSFICFDVSEKMMKPANKYIEEKTGYTIKKVYEKGE